MSDILACVIWLSSANFADRLVAQVPPKVEQVREIGPQFIENSVGITGLDGATSFPLPDGTSLWTFGDTVVGPFQSIRELPLGPLLSSTAAIVSDDDASDGLQGFRFLASPDGRRARQVLAYEAGETPERQRLWPVNGTVVGRDVYLFYHKITLLPNTNVFENFQLDGMGIAKASLDDFVFRRLRAPDGTFEFWKGSEPGFGVYVTRADDGYAYLWGSQLTAMFLARCRPQSLSDLDQYEYLVAAPDAAHPNRDVQWSRQLQRPHACFDNVPNEMSASYNAYLRCYLAIHMWNVENKIVMRTAPALTGPWSAAQEVCRPTSEQPSDHFYAAKEHPELAREGGRTTYLTFVNAGRYAPRLLEVRWSASP